jgi:hypothetical protein
VFDDWPNRFFDFAHEISLEARRQRKHGFLSEFRHLRQLTQGKTYFPLPTLLDALTTFALHHWTGGYIIQCQWPPNANQESRFVNKRWAGPLLGMRTLNQALKTGEVRSRVEKNSRNTDVLLIEREDILRIVREGEEFMGIIEAVKLLNIKYRHVMALIRCGLLETTRKVAPKSPIKLAVHRSSIRSLVTRLAESCCPDMPPPAAKSFKTATFLASRAGISFENFALGVVSGGLRFYARGEIRFRNLLFDKSDLERWLAVAKRESTGEDYLAVIDARGRLNVPDRFFARLRAAGYLGPRHTCSVVALKHIEDFEENYVFAREIASGVQTTSSWITLYLRTLNVTPILVWKWRPAVTSYSRALIRNLRPEDLRKGFLEFQAARRAAK